MAKHYPVILLEFNELTPSLMTRFMAEGKLPNFQRFYREAQVYTTDAGEDPPNLNPWIQWVTVHSGIPFSEHGVFLLDDGHKLKQKCLWDVLSDARLRVWICGSMNIRYEEGINGIILPDPWSTGCVPYPSDLLPYYKFVRRNVQEHTNDDVSFSMHDYGEFLLFMLGHGLSLSTVTSILRQLLRELSGKYKWKRTDILDRVQLDLFAWYFRKYRPHFSTFFSNSTAHLQHCYWREMEPEKFKIAPKPDERRERENAILFGYQGMDRTIGEFLDIAGSDATLIFCTALSQQPCTTYEDDGGKRFYRPRHFDVVGKFAGLRSRHTVSPVMSEEFQLRFEATEDAQFSAERLKALHVGGRQAMLVHQNGKDLYVGCCLHDQLSRDAVLEMKDTGKQIPFFTVFYQSEGIKSGIHHRDGLLWIRRPDRSHVVHEDKVSLCRIAPTVLKMFDVKGPDSMREQPLF